MTNTIQLLFYLATLAVAHKIFDLRSFNNPFVVFIIFNFVFLMVGGTYHHIYDGTFYETNEGIVSKIMWASSIGNLLALLVAMLFLRARKINVVKISKIEIVNKPDSLLFILGAIIAFFGIVLSLYFIGTKGFQIGEGSDGGRISAREGMGAFTIFSVNTILVGTLVMLANRKGGVLSVAATNAIFIAGIVCLASFGNRFPVLLHVVCYYFVSQIVVKDRKIPIWKIVVFGSVTFIAFVLLGILRKGVDGATGLIFINLPWRPYVNFYNLETILTGFHEKSLYGYSYVMDIMQLSPSQNYNFGQWLKNNLGMDYEGGSVTYTYLGEGYVNFGWVGFWVYAFLYPMFFLITFIAWFNKRSVTRTKAATYILLAVGINPAVSSGLLPCIIYSTIPQILLIVSILAVRTALSRKGNL